MKTRLHSMLTCTKWKILRSTIKPSLLCFALLAITSFGFAQTEILTGVDTAIFNMITNAQQTSEWCWAASISTVLAYYRVSVSQQQIVEHTFGQVIVKGATDDQITAALNGWAISSQGETLTIHSVYGSGLLPVPILIQELNQKRPIIVAFQSGPLSGHCVVITGAGYINSASGPLVNELIIRDPWPSPEDVANLGKRVLTFNDLSQFLSNMRSYWIVSVVKGAEVGETSQESDYDSSDDDKDEGISVGRRRGEGERTSASRGSASDSDPEFNAKLNQIIEAASSGLRPLRGASKSDDSWVSTVTLPSADSCTVTIYESGNGSVSCLMARSDSPDALDSTYDALVTKLETALPGWSAENVTEQNDIKAIMMRRGRGSTVFVYLRLRKAGRIFLDISRKA